MSKRQVYLYLHTHWDREWYRTFESYRYRLIRSLQNILSYLESDTEHQFLLDGQTVVLEDYLEFCPEDNHRLNALISEGRLQVGPWYVLPDEFLISGESLIRNLQLGMQQAARYGQRQFCGYLPDMFGHPAQIPQILDQCKLAPAVIWRGIQPESSYFSWKGLAGNSLPTQHLTKGYYQDALHMETPDKDILVSFLDAIEKATPESLPMLLPIGADHMGLPTDLKKRLNWLEEAFPQYNFKRSTLQDYLKVLSDHPESPHIREANQHTGELRQPEGAYVLPGVWSTRYPLKQENAQCQNLLEREIEPLLVLQHLYSDTPPLWSALNQAWKYLLKNHPHDSICGCSIDAVHQDMMPRFEWVKQLANELRQDAYVHWGQQQLGANPGAYLNLVNTGPETFHNYVDVELHFPEKPSSVQLRNPEGGMLCPLWILPENPKACHEIFVAEPEILPHWEDVHRVRCRIQVQIKPFSTLSLAIETPKVETRQPFHGADYTKINDFWNSHCLNNGKVRLRISNGQLIFERKREQVWIHQVSGHFFVHEADAGDEYNFSPPETPKHPVQEIVSFQEAVVEHYPGEQILRLKAKVFIPEGLTSDRKERSQQQVPLHIQTDIHLFEDNESFDFRTTVVNAAKDYRLKLCWQPALAPTHVRSSTLLGAVEQNPKPKQAPWDAEKGKERPVDEFPFQEWIHVKQPDQNGWCFQSTGLYEASLTPFEEESTLSITLLRSVGWLSRDDLRTRGGGAGPRMPTPEAQCIGKHNYNYSLHLKGADEPQTLKVIEQQRHPVLAFQGKALSQQLFKNYRGTLHVSALKMGLQRPEVLVLRMVNESSRVQEFSLQPTFHWNEVHKGNPLEQPVQSLATEYIDTFTLSDTLAPGEISTYLFYTNTSATLKNEVLL